MIRYKSIKPRPFKDKEMSRILREQVKEFGRARLIKRLEEITKNWEGDKPEWKIVYKSNQVQVSVEIVPTDPTSYGAMKFLWLDKGTSPHSIDAKSKKGMSFLTPYKAGSTPGKLTVGKKQEGTNRVYGAQHIDHPGNEARDWTGWIGVADQAAFEVHMRGALRDAAAASGHGVK